MGWQAGQGLGKNGEGSTSHIKQTRKHDNRGIGATAATRDEAFRASQDLFNGVLARLNGKSDEPDADSPNVLGQAATTVKGAIAKRQLAHRFRRAKDTAGASATDLAAIFGRKQSVPAVDEAHATSAVTTRTEIHVEAPPEQHTSNLSLNEYFARKRRELGLAPVAVTVAGASLGGFSLDDQAMFAEMQVAASYSGRVGLGMGSTGGASASWKSNQYAVPQKRYTDVSWIDPGAALPTPATLAAHTERSKLAEKLPTDGAEHLTKAERKAAKKEARKVEKKAAKRAAKEAAAAAESAIKASSGKAEKVGGEVGNVSAACAEAMKPKKTSKRRREGENRSIIVDEEHVTKEEQAETTDKKNRKQKKGKLVAKDRKGEKGSMS
eukprot:scaffold292497_cov32-Tisochrysis_lutea.AAC.1